MSHWENRPKSGRIWLQYINATYMHVYTHIISYVRFIQTNSVYRKAAQNVILDDTWKYLQVCYMVRHKMESMTWDLGWYMFGTFQIASNQLCFFEATMSTMTFFSYWGMIRVSGTSSNSDFVHAGYQVTKAANSWPWIFFRRLIQLIWMVLLLETTNQLTWRSF